MDALLIVYAYLIPLVPLWGAGHFKKREEPKKQYVCIFLFLAQLVVSTFAVWVKFF